jgi:hypothetical protein
VGTTINNSFAPENNCEVTQSGCSYPVIEVIVDWPNNNILNLSHRLQARAQGTVGNWLSLSLVYTDWKN